MLPARQAPVVGLAYASTAVTGMVALLRLLDVARPPTSRAEATTWSLVSAALLAVSGGAAHLARVEERRECGTTLERASQAQRNARAMAENLVLANAYSLLAFLLAVVWRAQVTALRDALTMLACLGVLLTGWYFASTVPYALLPRVPEVEGDDAKKSDGALRRGAAAR